MKTYTEELKCERCKGKGWLDSGTTNGPDDLPCRECDCTGVIKRKTQTVDIKGKLLGASKEWLVASMMASDRHHNEFCRTAARLRQHAQALAKALRPFSELMDENEQESFATVPIDVLHEARRVYRASRKDVDDQYRETIRAPPGSRSKR